MKTSDGWFSLSIRREGQYKDYVKGTTSVSTLSYEIVGFGGDDIDSTTLTSLSKGRVGQTTCFPLSKERVVSTKDGTGSTTLSTNGSQGTTYGNLLEVVIEEQ